MIIGKADKKRVEDLENTYYEQQKKIQELKYRLDSPKEDDSKDYISYLVAQIKDYKKREEEILTILKAIINKFSKQEIVIDEREITEAKEYKLIKQNEWLSNAKVYRTLNPKCLLDSYKEE